MSESDWTAFTAANNDGLDAGFVSKGVTNAFAAPAGGTDFVHAFHALTADAVGVAGYYYNRSEFNPITPGYKGGSVRAAMLRYAP